MMNFIVGYYVNQDGQEHCTVVVRTYSVGLAMWIRRKIEKENQLFRPSTLEEITEKEIEEIQNSNDIWNQIELI